MGRSNKWIESQPDDSIEDVARRALESRLERTWHYLRDEVRSPRSDAENVHQLRVVARRTAAAMEIFGAWLPKKRGEWMDKQMKKLRKAAGEARDFDVMASAWLTRAERSPSNEAMHLLEQIKQHRKQAEQPIEAIYKKLARKDFRRRTKKLVNRVRTRESSPACDGRFGCLAKVALAQLVTPYLATAQQELPDVESLHAFRIQGKQVRYAMEIFAGAFDADFRQQLFPVVATLQDRLGAVNDPVTAKAYFAEWLLAADENSAREALEFGLQEEQRALEENRREFLAWWTRQRRTDLHRSFAKHLQIDAPVEPAARYEDCGG